MTIQHCEFSRNPDGSYDLLLYLEGRMQAEFADDFFHNRPFKHLDGVFRKAGRVIRIRTVKLVIAGTLVAAIPFSSAAVHASGEYAMSYVYFGTAAQQIQNIARAADTLDVVSPSYFNLNRDGSLALSGVSTSFLSAMRERGLRVVPFLSNHWDRESGVNALKNADSLVEEIRVAVERYGFDGVNVDIENVTASERELYTAFVKKLRAALPKSKEVSVAVAANPYGYQTGWHGSYDYEGLAKYADHLFLMTYDEHYNGSAAGPVASFDFVERSIQYALKYASPDQIVVGIPFFGRLWNAAGTVKGHGISLTAAMEYQKAYGGTVRFDEASKSPVMTFTIRPADSRPVLNGQTLPTGNYTLWLENADSIKYKLQLVSKYGLKGAGNWSAGQETPDVWEYYGLWLGGTYFSDIHGHFAKDDIISVSSEGLMRGVSYTLFSPDETLTRAQAAVIATRTLGLAAGSAAPFPDTAGHWASDEIAAAARAGLMKGYPDGTFRPDARVTRAELSVLLSRMIESTYTREAAFHDVGADHWAAGEITALAARDILRGYADGTFRPENNITRGETAAVINRLIQLLD